MTASGDQQYEARYQQWRATQRRVGEVLDSQPYRPVGTPLTPEEEADHRTRTAQFRADLKAADAAETAARKRLALPWEQ
ncbi:hypothetical protein [Streptomyces malaysiensis]|uniref:hypothetical protein n=1 Tax=Streptomyces malaysiensis TaxID=92644 RepID=UPI000BFC968B|nr:hypothetical protein [Streptomyces malaysiensis]ATL80258.1 DEAD-like helicase [Streptomyces malaysiensis]